MNPVATAPGWTIEVTSASQTQGWFVDVAISDSVHAVEAAKKLQDFPGDARFMVKSQLSSAEMSALRLKEGQARLRRASAADATQKASK